MSTPHPLATVADLQTRTEVELTLEQKGLGGSADRRCVRNGTRPRPGIFRSPPPATAPGVICTALLRTLASPPPDGNTSETVGGHTRTAAHAMAFSTSPMTSSTRSARPCPEPRGAFSIWTARDPGNGQAPRPSAGACRSYRPDSTPPVAPPTGFTRTEQRHATRAASSGISLAWLGRNDTKASKRHCSGTTWLIMPEQRRSLNSPMVSEIPLGHNHIRHIVDL
ncbi:hypothetical protein FKR81_37335 [Lentzea tibetensis]|uniref:Uncharacterized protein n=1 Tax=Lentzea tibetensis TaxID=2591470 RepID=A0A563EHL0_9PSEU|nr:hypothetical protein [Lentzea tibetensis]TWP46039.1 hypothetical protein FKR81_37335 [Lentzea tibetensis]